MRDRTGPDGRRRAAAGLRWSGASRPWTGSLCSMGSGEAGGVGSGKNEGWWQLQSSASTWF